MLYDIPTNPFPATEPSRNPHSDPYGAKQDVLAAHVGTIYDIARNQKATLIDMQEEIAELRSLLMATLELVAASSTPS